MFRQEGVQSKGRGINLLRAPGTRILVSYLGGPMDIRRNTFIILNWYKRSTFYNIFQIKMDLWSLVKHSFSSNLDKTWIRFIEEKSKIYQILTFGQVLKISDEIVKSLEGLDRIGVLGFMFNEDTSEVLGYFPALIAAIRWATQSFILFKLIFFPNLMQPLFNFRFIKWILMIPGFIVFPFLVIMVFP